MTLKAIFAGSFDPITLGHIDLIKRSLNFCDELIVAVGINANKKYLFDDNTKLSLINYSLIDTLISKSLNSITVSSYNCLLVDYARNFNAKLLIRGARTPADYEYENSLALINKKLAPEIETIILPADPQLSIISSSMVKELAKFEKDCSGFVTKKVNQALKQKFNHVNVRQIY